MSATEELTHLIENWAKSVHAGDLAGVLEHHSDDIVMFDVPPPDDGVRGLAAYRDVWLPFFEWQKSGAVFEPVEINVVADEAVAFAFALFRCGTREELADAPQRRLRLTLGFRKTGGAWTVVHEHHSFADLPEEAR